MNLENRDKMMSGNLRDDSYAENELDEFSAAGNDKSDDKMHRILKELENLKADIAHSTVNSATRRTTIMGQNTKIDVPSMASQQSREDNIQVQNAQNIQIALLKEELARVRTERVTNNGADNSVLIMELRHMHERIEAMEREKSLTSQGIVRPSIPTDSYATRSPYTTQAPVADYRATTNVFDDIDARLVHIDTQVTELSAMAVSNDVAPMTKELLTLKEQLTSISAKLGFGAPENGLDLTDKILDELVRVQTSVEDVKKSLEEHGRSTSSIQTDEYASITSRDDLYCAQGEIGEVRAELVDGFRELNEQIAALHADIKIYVEEGMFSSLKETDNDNKENVENNAILNVVPQEALLCKLEKIEASIDAIAHVPVSTERSNEILEQLGEFRADFLTNVSEQNYADQLASIHANIQSLRAIPESNSSSAVCSTDSRDVLDAVAALRQDLAQFVTMKMGLDTEDIPRSSIDETTVRRIFREELRAIFGNRESSAVPVERVSAKASSTVKKESVKKPVAKKTTAKKPVAKKTTTKKPAAKKTTTKKPAAKKVTTKKSTAKKTTTKKPVAKKPPTKSSNVAKNASEAETHVLTDIQPKIESQVRTSTFVDHSVAAVKEPKSVFASQNKSSTLSKPDDLARQVSTRLSIAKMFDNNSEE